MMMPQPETRRKICSGCTSVQNGFTEGNHEGRQSNAERRFDSAKRKEGRAALPCDATYGMMPRIRIYTTSHSSYSITYDYLLL
jgi:hypothetical protein